MCWPLARVCTNVKKVGSFISTLSFSPPIVPRSKKVVDFFSTANKTKKNLPFINIYIYRERDVRRKILIQLRWVTIVVQFNNNHNTTLITIASHRQTNHEIISGPRCRRLAFKTHNKLRTHSTPVPWLSYSSVYHPESSRSSNSIFSKTTLLATQKKWCRWKHLAEIHLSLDRDAHSTVETICFSRKTISKKRYHRGVVQRDISWSTTTTASSSRVIVISFPFSVDYDTAVGHSRTVP